MLSKCLPCVVELPWRKPVLLCPRSVLRPQHTRGRFHSRSNADAYSVRHASDPPPLLISKLFKPLVFSVGFTTLSLGGCAIWQYERLRKHAINYLKKPVHWGSDQQKKQNKLAQWWSGLKDGEKVYYPILAANLIVFGLWRVRGLQNFMVKYFCSNPASGAVCTPMVLSTFSHYATLHLAANMFVLYSFIPAAVGTLGKEQFMAMYLSGGVWSSFASLAVKTFTNNPGPSLGASGAIMTVLAYVCVQYPDTQLSIILLPFYTFAAGNAIKVIMSLDFAGVMMGWRFLDHAAHLGGALFGIGWCTWGGQHLWGNRDKVQQYWHTLRESGSSGR